MPHSHAAVSRSFKLFRIFGFQVAIDYTWFIIFALVTWSLSTYYLPQRFPGLSPGAYWISGTAAAILLFVSVVLHELSHSLVARRNGLEISGITLFIFGGIAKISSEPRDAKSELKISIAGPLCSIVLAVIFYVISTLVRRVYGVSIVSVSLGYLAMINGLLAAFNLIPGFPLDGGRIFRAFIWKKTGNFRRATRMASSVGRAFGLFLIFLGILGMLSGAFIAGLFYIFIGLFLRQAAELSFEQVIMKDALSGVKVRDVMTEGAVCIDAAATVQEAIDNYFFHYRFRCFPVTRAGRFVGLVTLHDVKDVPREKWRTERIEAALTPMDRELHVSPRDEAVDVLAMMLKTGQGRLPVIENERVIGMVTRRDVMTLLQLKTDLG
jgi:Zn-dependent protease/predicted transcriptional regulator